jgi:hypothetical protein
MRIVLFSIMNCHIMHARYGYYACYMPVQYMSITEVDGVPGKAVQAEVQTLKLGNTHKLLNHPQTY